MLSPEDKQTEEPPKQKRRKLESQHPHDQIVLLVTKIHARRITRVNVPVQEPVLAHNPAHRRIVLRLLGHNNDREKAVLFPAETRRVRPISLLDARPDLALVHQRIRLEVHQEDPQADQRHLLQVLLMRALEMRLAGLEDLLPNQIGDQQERLARLIEDQLERLAQPTEVLRINLYGRGIVDRRMPLQAEHHRQLGLGTVV